MDSHSVRELLRVHGSVEQQDSADWKGLFPLPGALAAFYRDVGPVDITIEGYGNPTYLPSLAHLWEHQAGYRWNGATGEPIPEWNDDWIVVADEGADPFIFSIADGAILYAHHGTGSWDADRLYANINAMAACMATLGGVVLDAGDTFTDENSNINPEHRASAVARLTELLGDAREAEIIVETAGWG